MSNLIAGKYKIEESDFSLAGGFAQVYKAWDVELNRYAAIKYPNQSNRTPESIKVFRREAELTAQLTHPNIVEVYGSGLSEDPPYVILEWLPDSLAILLEQETRISWLRAAKFAAQICDALDVAHNQEPELVHQDIKPDNLFRTRHEVIKVADFGLAIALRSVPSSSSLYLAGSGTPEYMAPEQWHGEVPTGQVDIYALGITLFELITGKPPFSGRNGFLTGQMHLNEPLPDLPNDLGIPSELITIINKATEKNVLHRYSTADLMAEDLRDLIDTNDPDTQRQRDLREERRLTDQLKRLRERMQIKGQGPIEVSPDITQIAEPESPVGLNIDSRPNGAPVIEPELSENTTGSSAGPSSTDTGPGGYTLGQPRDVDTLNRIIESGDGTHETFVERAGAYLKAEVPSPSNAIDDCDNAILSLPEYWPAHAIRGFAYHELEDFENAADSFGVAILHNPEIEPEVIIGHGNACLNIGRFQEGLKNLSLLIESGEDTDGRGLLLRGRLYQELDQHEPAIADFTSGISLTNDSEELSIDHYGFYHGRGLSYIELGDSGAALKDLLAARALSPDEASAHYWLGSVYADLDQEENAVESFTKAITLDPNSPDYYAFRAYCYETLGEYQNAVDDLTKLFTLRDVSPSDMALRGHCYLYLDEERKATEDYGRAISLMESSLNPDIERLKEIYAVRADTYFDNDDYEKALADRLRIVELDEKTPEALPGDLYWCGVCYFGLADFNNALRYLNQSIQLEPKDWQPYQYRGLTYAALEDHEKAVEDYTESIKRDKGSSFDGNSPMIYVERGASRLKLGHYRRAISDFNKARTMGVDASVLNYLGEAYLRIGQLDKAAEELESAIQQLDDSDSWRLRGVLYALAGDIDQAVQCLSESEMRDWRDRADKILLVVGTQERQGQTLSLQSRIKERENTFVRYKTFLQQLDLDDSKFIETLKRIQETREL